MATIDEIRFTFFFEKMGVLFFLHIYGLDPDAVSGTSYQIEDE